MKCIFSELAVWTVCTSVRVKQNAIAESGRWLCNTQDTEGRGAGKAGSKDFHKISQ